MLLQLEALCWWRGSLMVLSKHSCAKSFPLQVQGLHKEQRGFFPRNSPWQLSDVLWLLVKKKSQLDSACSVKEHQEPGAALGSGSSWLPTLPEKPPQFHHKEPNTFSSFQKINVEE